MKTKIKTSKIYNSCSGKKGTGCDSIDYILPYGNKNSNIKSSCNGSAGCAISKKYITPRDIIV